MNLQDRLFSVIQALGLPQDAMLVVGVSGGTDSLALMHALAALYERLSLKLHAATLDHGLRGAAGADDVRFVAETAQAWGLAVTTGYTDVRALADERHLSIEAAARLARYDFLVQVARQVGARHVVVAHHADDQAETILHNLLRGTGLKGLTGMSVRAPLPGHPDLTLIRPLLSVTRAELEVYCREHSLHPRSDATNADVSLTRNRLRHVTLPYLRELSPQFERHLLQLGEIADVEDDFADAALHAAVDAHITQHGQRIMLPRPVFAGLHPALQRRFVAWAAQRLGHGMDVGYIHITAAVALALRGQVGARAQLKGDIQLRVDYHDLIVEHDNETMTDKFPLVPADAELPLSFPGEIGLNDGWLLSASLTPFEDAQEATVARVALPENSAVMLRGRRKGDRFPSSNHYSKSLPERVGHSHKLTEWMIDHKVPRHLRERSPLIVVDGQVAAVWWQGWTVSRHFAADADTKLVGYFVIKRINYENGLKR